MYPLEALLVLHDDALDAAQRAHTETLKSLEAASLQKRACQQALDAHQTQTRTPQPHPTTAAEAQTQHAWQVRRREEATLLLHELEAAQRNEQARQTEEAAAHVRLREALSQRQSADAHHEGWKQGVQQAANMVEERETEERR